MSEQILIVDYGMGNIFSIGKVLERLGFAYQISHSPEEIVAATRIILPGVGHFGKAMEHLQHAQLVDALNEAALIKKIPTLGICLGMQLMAGFSEEGNVNGLGWFDARVRHFQIQNRALYKVPHMGWNTTLACKPESSILRGLKPDAEFYFVHSYHIELADKSDALTTTPYEYPFVSAIQKENITGVQFHPEKSHEAGYQLIKNFLAQ